MFLKKATKKWEAFVNVQKLLLPEGDFRLLFEKAPLLWSEGEKCKGLVLAVKSMLYGFLFHMKVTEAFYKKGEQNMISHNMKKLIEKSAGISALFTEAKRMKQQYGPENVYDFGIGNPNVKAPESINKTAIEILQREESLLLHGYTDTVGYAEVRKKIANHLNRRFDTDFAEDNIVMTVGAAGGLNVIFKVLLNPEEEVLTFAPFFSEYSAYAMNAGAVLNAVAPNLETFLPDLTALEESITEKTKIVLINSPNNPTGVVYDESIIAEIGCILEEKQKEYGTSIYLVADEPYRELVYDGAEVPYVPHYYKNTIVAYSFSKSLSLPGDRIGYLVLPSELEDFEQIRQGAEVATRVLGFVNAPALQQRVVAECCDELTDVAFYDANRELLYTALQSYGYECIKPQGAFYLFVKALEADDNAFCQKAKEYRLLLTPATGFGCPGYVRIAYCVSRQTIEKALPAFEALKKYYEADTYGSVDA